MQAPVLRAREEIPAAPPAANPPAAANEADLAFERFNSGSRDVETLSVVLPQLARQDRRERIRKTIVDSKSPPRSELVILLEHPQLAVRLGALEILEALAGSDHSYNPWAPADCAENRASLTRWKAWAGEPATASSNAVLFSADQRQGYLRDLLGEDADKAARARHMLSAEGLAAVGFLDQFLNHHPTLPPIGRSRVREAQYQITLERQLGDQAALIARHLAFGSRDQLLAALEKVRAAGTMAIPILKEFLSHGDPLVRETAIDSLLVCAGADGVPLVAPVLAKESDVNVIHGALRRLKDIRSPASLELVASFLNHPDEDLLVSAIQTCQSLSGSGGRYSSSKGLTVSKPTLEAVVKLLKDPRWRVRAVAFEAIAQCKVSSAKAEAIQGLDDPDEFVRAAAIKAVAALAAKESLPKLKAMMLANLEMTAPVIEAYGEMKLAPDAEMLEKLDSAPPEVRLAALSASKSNDAQLALWLRYANDPSQDVATTALRTLAAADDGFKMPQISGAVLAALRSNDPQKIAAVLENLDLPTPSSGSVSPSLLGAATQAAGTPSGPTRLDPLYDAFAKATPAKASPPPSSPAQPASIAKLTAELHRFLTPETPPRQRYSAAINLASVSDDAGAAVLLRDLPSLDTTQRVRAAEAASKAGGPSFVPLLKALLRDPAAQVRKEAAESCFSNEKSRALIQLVLTELGLPDARLNPQDLYGYRFDYAAREQTALFRSWCLDVLNAESSSTPMRVLATIAARHQKSPEIHSALAKHADSKDTILRRAALFALLTAKPAELATRADAIAADPDARVRAVLPNRVHRPGNGWQHWFTDALAYDDQHSDYSFSRKAIRIPETVKPLLNRLATQDPSAAIRYDASFALLKAGEPVDVQTFATLITKQPKSARAPYQVGDWLGDNWKRATPALAPLMSAIDLGAVDQDEIGPLRAKVFPQASKPAESFAALAETASAQPTGKAALAPEPPAAAEAAAPKRTSLELVFFHKPGCRECEKSREILAALKTDFPLLKVAEHNILEPDSLVLNQALCQRFNVPSQRHGLAPAVFSQSGFMIGTDITPTSIGALLEKTMSAPQDDTWDNTDAPARLAATAAVEQRFSDLTLPVVLLGGLLDGINPCAFATIVFLLSYLKIARRTPRELLMIGGSFVLAVFLSYLAAGWLLHHALATIGSRFAGVRTVLNGGFAALALLAAVLSLRDAFRARSGRTSEMTLQLPDFLKSRIRSVIRTGARARHFVVAAFLTGVAVSFLELACTGQVYAPIIYQIQKGQLHAMNWLVLYNLAFITPLAAVFALACFGLGNDTLMRFQKHHTAAVKFALAALFFVLAAVILLTNA